MKNAVKKAYQNIEPSEKLMQETRLLIRKQNKRKEVIKLFVSCGISAAACFAIAMVLPVFVKTNTVPTQVASVFSNGSTIAISLILFVLLCSIFIIRFYRRRE